MASGRGFTRLMAVCCGAALLASGVAAADDDRRVDDDPRLIVRVYNSFGAPADDLHRAFTIASAVLWRAGIHTAWRDCGFTECDDPLGPAEIIVRVAATNASSEPHSLGFSYVDVRERAGTLSTVYGDRVNALAKEAEVDAGELLGRAMAHELGHLLLGTSRHAVSGLMRGVWSTADLRRDDPSQWLVSHGDAVQMRTRLRSRLRLQPQPRLLVAAQLSDSLAGEDHALMVQCENDDHTSRTMCDRRRSSRRRGM